MALFGPKRSHDEQVAEIERLAIEAFAREGITGELVRDPEDPLNTSIRTPWGAAVGLYNLTVKCLSAPERRRPRIVTDHVRSIGPLIQRETIPADLRDPASFVGLRARLMPEDTARLADLSYGRPFAPGVIEVLCLDLPQTVQLLSRDMLADNDPYELFAIGRANLRLEPAPSVTELDAGLWLLEGESLFTASRMVDPAFVAERLAPCPRGVVFSIPDRHLLAFAPVTGAESVVTVQKLVMFTIRVTADDCPGGVLSPEVYYRGTDGAIQQITSRGEDGAIGIRAEGPFLDAVNT